VNRHLTNKELAVYIARTAGERSRSGIAGHLSGCDRCRSRHEKILAATAPRYSSLRASDAAKIRIMRSRDKLAEDETALAPKGLRSILALHPRAVLAASLAVVTIFVVTAALLFLPPAVEKRPFLTAAQADSGVIVNGHPAGDRDRIFEQSSIRVPDKTMARMEYGPGFSITLIGPAVLSIDRLMPPGPSTPVELECTLTQGILVSANKESTKKTVSYVYNTPGARVEPMGTEFLLQSAGDSTLVLMKTGSVSVKPARSAESVSVSAGSRCVVSEKAEISKAMPEDLKIFSSMEQLRDGAFEGQLMKPEPLEKEKKLKQSIREGRPADRKKIRDDIVQGPQLESPGDRDKSSRRDKIENPARPGMREQERINKNKKQIREAQKATRQKRRASR
jgi:hypothetical protein